jgi:hypothetical protein
VPIAVSRSGSNGAQVTVGVCVGAQGPYTFLVDSGSQATLIDESLANQVGSGPGYPHNTDRCDGVQGAEDISSMTIGSRKIDDTSVGVANLRSIAGNLSGIIGSDLLDRFGVVRLDYDRDTMAIGLEGPPTASRPGTRRARSVPRRLRSGTVTAVPMSVRVNSVDPISASDVVTPSVPITLDGKPDTFVLDTGAEVSAVSVGTATKDLPADQPGRSFTATFGLGCRQKATDYPVRQLRVGSASVGATTVASLALPAAVDGLLGSGTLQHFSPVVLDFYDGTLLLGARHKPISGVTSGSPG